MLETPRERDRFIDTWRAIAIILVAYWHYVDRLPQEVLYGERAPSLPMQFGYLGVEIFFVISAFLVAPAAAQAPSLAAFLARRISRIWPLFVVASCFVFAVSLFVPAPVVATGPQHFDASGRTLADLIGSIFLLKDLGFEWVDGAYWSILVEVKFYILLALLLALFRARFTVALGVAAIVLGGLYLVCSTGAFVGAEAGRKVSALLIGPYLPFFAIGALLGTGQRSPLLTLNILMAITLVALAMERQPEMSGPDTIRFLLVLGALLMADWLLLRQRATFWIARYSFGIYLFHQVLGLTMLQHLAPHMHPDAALLATFAAIFGLAWAASQAAEYRFQPMMIRLLTPLLSIGALARSGYAYKPSPERG